MSLHQPIMPFKWRPFDLYNDIHINCATGDNSSGVTASSPTTAVTTTAAAAATTPTSACSNCVRCQNNCDHLVLWGNFRKHRQSSRGSSSGSSCASLSTASHFVPDVDSASSRSTIKSSGSFQYYHKLLSPNNESNRDKSRCPAHHQQQQRHRAGCNGANVNCYCGSNCRNVTRNRASIYNNDMICRSQNSIITVPLQRTKSMNKLREMHAPTTGPNGNASKSTSLKSIVSCKSTRTNEFNGDTLDNLQFNDNDASISNRSLADSKY